MPVVMTSWTLENLQLALPSVIKVMESSGFLFLFFFQIARHPAHTVAMVAIGDLETIVSALTRIKPLILNF